MDDKKKICRECRYWSAIDNQEGVIHTGACHYWPPSSSKLISEEIRVEQVKNPRIYEIKERLAEAESLQKKLASNSKEIFSEYPVKKSLDELEEARQEVQDGDRNIKYLIDELDRVETEAPLVDKNTLCRMECGIWPRTASDDWCGQWKRIE